MRTRISILHGELLAIPKSAVGALRLGYELSAHKARLALLEKVLAEYPVGSATGESRTADPRWVSESHLPITQPSPADRTR